LCLESKCQPLYATVGGMMWPMIWKEKVTPRGRKLGQLVVSVRPTSGTDYGLWQTPNTMDGMGDRSPEAMARQFSTTRKGRTAPANLREQVNPAMWPTPTSRDHKDGIFTPNVPVNGLLGRMVWNGSNARTENKGQLNPEFVCWLMGYSTAHLSSMVSAMQSFRKSRQSLSRQLKNRIEV